MQERHYLRNLELTDEDYVFDGNLIIKERFSIKNGSLRVSGKLVLEGFTEEIPLRNECKIHNGNIIADSIDSRIRISVFNGNIVSNSIETFENIYIRNGNIFIKSNAYFKNITVKGGDITVNGSCVVNNVKCKNYLISGRNDSDEVTATEDIYILGPNFSGDLKAREIFIGSYCKFDPASKISVTAKHFECEGPIKNSFGMLIG